MTDNKDVQKYHTEPSIPSWFVCLGIVLAICGTLYAYSENEIRFLRLAILFLIIIVFFLFYFCYKCYQNKEYLYRCYEDKDKLAKTQSALRKKAEEDLNKSNGQLKTIQLLFSILTKRSR